MKATYHGTENSPFHLSVGAVLVNDAGNIACQRFADGSYTLMRESVENDETPIAAVQRGLREELGASADDIRYLGSTVTYFTRSEDGPEIEKTTLWHLAFLRSIDEASRALEPYEEETRIEWKTPDELTNSDRNQSKLQIDSAEVTIIQRAVVQMTARQV